MSDEPETKTESPKKKVPRFLMVGHDFIDSPLSAIAKDIALLIARHQSFKLGYWEVRQARIAEMARCSIDLAQQGLDELARAGVATVERRRGQDSRYAVPLVDGKLVLARSADAEPTAHSGNLRTRNLPLTAVTSKTKKPNLPLTAVTPTAHSGNLGGDSNVSRAPRQIEIDSDVSEAVLNSVAIITTTTMLDSRDDEVGGGGDFTSLGERRGSPEPGAGLEDSARPERPLSPTVSSSSLIGPPNASCPSPQSPLPAALALSPMQASSAPLEVLAATSEQMAIAEQERFRFELAAVGIVVDKYAVMVEQVEVPTLRAILADCPKPEQFLGRARAYADLAAYRVTPKKTMTLIATYDLPRINRQLNWIELRPSARDKAATLVKSIEEDWAEPIAAKTKGSKSKKSGSIYTSMMRHDDVDDDAAMRARMERYGGIQRDVRPVEEPDTSRMHSGYRGMIHD
jgi:hypothetical protein